MTEVWQDVDLQKYEPEEPSIMPVLYDQEYKNLLTNLNFALDNNELSQRVYNLTSLIIRRSPIHFTAQTLRRRCIKNSLLFYQNQIEQCLNIKLDEQQQDNLDLQKLNLNFEIQQLNYECKFQLKHQPNIKQLLKNNEQSEQELTNIMQQQKLFITSELTFINNLILHKEQHKNFQLWNHKNEVVKMLSVLNIDQLGDDESTKQLNNLNQQIELFIAEYTTNVIYDNEDDKQTAKCQARFVQIEERCQLENLLLNELLSTLYILQLDEKNYHCYDYLIFLIKTIINDQQQMEAVSCIDFSERNKIILNNAQQKFIEIINQLFVKKQSFDVKNNSFYSMMMYCNLILLKSKINQNEDQLNIQQFCILKLNEAVEFCQKSTVNESTWSYLQGLIQYFQGQQQLDIDQFLFEAIKPFVLNHSSSDGKGVISSHAVYLRKMMTEYKFYKATDSDYKDLIKMCTTIAAIDTVRRAYWEFLSIQLQDKLDVKIE